MLMDNTTLLNHNHLLASCESRSSVVSSNRSEERLRVSIARPKYLIAVVLFSVICLHIVVLWLMLKTSAVTTQEVLPPTMVGVLIQKPSSEVIKAPENITPKKITAVKTTPKKRPPPVKKMPASEKAITLPEALVEPPVDSDFEDEPEYLDEPAQVEHAPVVAPRSDAAHLNNRAPVYPRASLRRHEEGKVVLELLVRADGTVGEVRVKESSGYQRLDQAALKAVRNWRYVPARQGGEVIDFWYQQPLLFSLRK